MNKCRMIFLSSLVLFAGIAMNASSQGTDFVVNRLAAGDGPGGAGITVTEKGDAASIVRMASSTRRSNKVNGYRVRIFFDNKQNARSQAIGALNRFRELFPGIPSDWKYDPPDFKVTVGNCLTNEEAVMLWGKVRNQFPKAFLIPENIPLEAFTHFSADPGQDSGDAEPAPAVN